MNRCKKRLELICSSFPFGCKVCKNCSFTMDYFERKDKVLIKSPFTNTFMEYDLTNGK